MARSAGRRPSDCSTRRSAPKCSRACGPSAFGLVHGLLFFSSHHCFPLVKFSVLIGQRKHLSPLFSCHLSFSPRVRTGHALLLRRLGEHHCTRSKSCLFRSTLDTHSVPFSPSEHKTILFPPITCVSSSQTIQQRISNARDNVLLCPSPPSLAHPHPHLPPSPYTCTVRC
jgi:hypothetical protein